MVSIQVRPLEAKHAAMGRIQQKRLTSLTSLFDNGINQNGKRQKRLPHECEANLVQKAEKQKTLAHQLQADLDPTGEKQKRLIHKSATDLDPKVKKQKTRAHQLEADLDPTGEKQSWLAHKSEADLDPNAEKQQGLAHQLEAELDPTREKQRRLAHNAEKQKGLARQLEADLNEVAWKQMTRQAHQLAEAEGSGVLKVQKRLRQNKFTILSDVDLNLSGGKQQRSLIGLKNKDEDIFPSSLVPFKTFLDQPDTETDSDIR
jgi:hypothetical protein